KNVFSRVVDFGERMQPLGNRSVQRATYPRVERLAALAILLIKIEKLADYCWNRARGNKHDLAAEADAVSAHFAAEKQLIVRRLLIFNFANVAVKADVGDVVLAARIRAATDLDAQLSDFGIVVAFERARKFIDQRERARDAEVAYNGSRAASD